MNTRTPPPSGPGCPGVVPSCLDIQLAKGATPEMNTRPKRARLVVASVAASFVAIGALTAVAPPAEALTGSCNASVAGTTTRVAPGSGKTVALTFDDNALENMPELLATLRKYNVRATFFNTGKQDAKMLPLVRQMAREGHLVEPHTWEHQYPTKANGSWSKSYLTNQIKTTMAQQQKQTGHVSCFFRPPGGYMNNVSAVAKSLGMRTVLWSVDTQDWSQPKYLSKAAQDAIVRKGTDLRYSNVNHPIVLMHGGKASPELEARVTSFRGNTLKALPRIIEWYKARGYRFVAMDGTSGLKPLAKAGFTSDSVPDLFTRTKTGVLNLYTGRGDGHVTGPRPISSGWNAMSAIVATDFTGDRKVDVLARSTKGNLLLYVGNGNGGFTGAARTIASGWNVFNLILAPGDVDGDGKNDLLARKPDGTLWLYRGNGKGGFAAAGKRIGTGWQAYIDVITPGDFTNDGKVDLLARNSKGELYLFTGTGKGTFAAARKVASGFAGYSHLFSAGDLNRDAAPDLVGLRKSDGMYVFFAGTGTATLRPGKTFRTGWTFTAAVGANV